MTRAIPFLLAMAAALSQRPITPDRDMTVARDVGSGIAGVNRPKPGTTLGPKTWAPDRNPIYDERADAQKLITQALAAAKEQRRRVVLDFGANWCGDCHAIDRAMRTPGLKEIIVHSYLYVPIDVGRVTDPEYGYAKNGKLAARYGVPLKKGIPAVAILDANGEVLTVQKEGEFADARHLSFEKIRDFFVKWAGKN